jgi:1-phosphofructokinase
VIHLLSLAPALDLEAEVRPPRKGKIGDLERFSWSPGGKAVNVARFLRACHIPFQLHLGAGGGSDPTHVLYDSLLSREGLKAAFLDPRAPIRVNLVTRLPKGASKFNHAGHALHPTSLADFARLSRRWHRGDWFVLTGRLPKGVPVSVPAGWIRTLEKRGTRCVVDASGPHLRELWGSRPAFFKVNLFEMGEGFGAPLRRLEDLYAYLPAFQRKGLIHGAVTDGAKGAIAWEGPEVARVSASRLTVSQQPVVGAGDAFLAGYLAAWRAGKSLVERARFASACGAVVAERGIAGFNVARARSLMKSVRVM